MGKARIYKNIMGHTVSISENTHIRFKEDMGYEMDAENVAIAAYCALEDDPHLGESDIKLSEAIEMRIIQELDSLVAFPADLLLPEG